MKISNVQPVCFCVGLLGLASANFGQTSQLSEAPYLKLGPIPQIKLLPSTTTAPAERDIERLIAALAEIDSPAIGLSATRSGTAFAPLKHLVEAGPFLLTRHRHKQNEAFRRLVESGPAALPLLLRSLTDKTPTKLTIRHDTMTGAMQFAREIGLNPMSAKESDLLKDWKDKDDYENLRITDSYTLRIGDACFVIIGQIVGRNYSAVRYQPTACIVINSPVEDPKLARVVNDIWSSKDARLALFNSLLIDYSTQGIFNGHSLDGWDVASTKQSKAATRLLYYFPRESAQLIATRLRGLDIGDGFGADNPVMTQAELGTAIKRQVKNGVRTGEFIRAVAWCKEPAIVEAIESLRKRATDKETLRLLDGG